MGRATTETSLDGLGPDLTARPPGHDDLDAVVTVVRDDEAHERGSPDTTRSDLAADWQRPSFDLARDAVVVCDGDRVVGYGEVAGGRTGVNVAPSHHGRGIGGAILAHLEQVARDLGERQVGQTVFDGNEAARRLHLDRGYRALWETWLFTIDLDEVPPVPEPPAGFRLREVDMDADARAAFDVIETAFATFSNREPGNFDDWRASYWDHEAVEPRHVHAVVDDEGAMAGVLLGLVEDGDGIVDQLGVLPSHHGKGLGRLLLRRAFARFAEDGVGSVYLSTESRGSARGFYEHAGMRLERSFTRFTKQLA